MGEVRKALLYGTWRVRGWNSYATYISDPHGGFYHGHSIVGSVGWVMVSTSRSRKEALFDLLQEVNCCSHGLELEARTAIRVNRGNSGYREVLYGLLNERLRSKAARERVVGYACAAVLGVRMDPPFDMLRHVEGKDGFALRVLFWTAQRRMGASASRARAWER